MITAMEAHLSHHHRRTLEKLFSHPPSGNVEWPEVLSLMRAVGTVTEQPNGKVKVSLGPETEVLHPPRGKDIDEPLIVDLRRMLRDAGYAPGGGPGVVDWRSRDYGDGRWGEPGE
jgi:hypothetical protein